MRFNTLLINALPPSISLSKRCRNTNDQSIHQTHYKMDKFKFIGSFLAWLLLAGISCWATEKSLHMLLPANWPEIAVWGITIAFFVVASIGTVLIVNSLMSDGFVDNRKGKLFGGILLVICFWLLMSMPTNTHTFFYNDKIGSTITEDIKTTNGYLQQIVEIGTSSTPVLDEEGKKLFDAVEEERRHLVAQFHGKEAPYIPGNGEMVGKHLEKINKLLNSQIIQNPNFASKDPSILASYQAQIDRARADALKTHMISPESVKSAREKKTRLAALNDSIQDHIASGSLSEQEIRQCEKELKDGYGIVASNKNFIHFDQSTNDEKVYTDENTETRTKRLSSVIDVFFVDFLNGKFPGSFWYYVILSILVDVAAFIFFDIAFKRHN